MITRGTQRRRVPPMPRSSKPRCPTARMYAPWPVDHEHMHMREKNIREGAEKGGDEEVIRVLTPSIRSDIDREKCESVRYVQLLTRVREITDLEIQIDEFEQLLRQRGGGKVNNNHFEYLADRVGADLGGQERGNDIRAARRRSLDKRFGLTNRN